MTDFQALPSQYDHSAAQEKWYAYWEKQEYFQADPQKVLSGEKQPFSVVIPPPNVTGALHLGHALNNTLQDILVRRKRMQGFEVLWQPGTDHAGIATQAVVERRLAEEEKNEKGEPLTRHDLGREGLVDRIWKWKEQYEKRILGQLKQLGASCDWSRTRFTLDDQCARAVRETFFKLFADGKIYRGKRLVNWDPFLQTAVSDDEVYHTQIKGHFWHFRYPVVDPKPGEPTHVTIATTRPETMLGDTAVAVHPDPAKQLDKVEAELKEKLAAANDKDKPAIEAQIEAIAERRKNKLPELETLRDMAQRGVKLKLPLTDREIPLITDVWAKPELGSGCVKITPAHDANDYEVWQRNEHIGTLNIMNADGTLASSVPGPFQGLTMRKARAAVLEALAEGGFHDPETDVEDREIDLAHSDRSKTPIEPYLADQWFVKMDELAQSAMDAVSDGKVKIIPERYGKSYLDWLSEKRDWPIGRQLWWGHRVPVWSKSFAGIDARDAIVAKVGQVDDAIGSGDGTEFTMSHDPDGANGVAYLCLREPNPLGEEAAKKLGFVQEEDVLDTWFSSALWPFSTLGWPDDTDALKAFYPTSTLSTSRDIITLWVARMVLMGEYLNPNNEEGGGVPFPEVYIHPKVLDGYGETMSKSKGNGVDPLDVIEKFGADALRFGIAYLTTETQDVRMPVEFECPHCQGNFKQTKKNRTLPVVECEKCKKPFSTQWAQTDEEKAHKRGAVTSERFELGRNFCNKLWNASRFALINLGDEELGKYTSASVPDDQLLLEDRWLLSRLATVTQQVDNHLAAYRFADAARALYDFAWDEFCSFYLEMTKARFSVPEQRPVAQRVLAYVLDSLLRLLHPMIPFVTEEVWQLLGEVAPTRGLTDSDLAQETSESVCVASWPEADTARIDTKIEEQFSDFQAVLGAIREIRTRQNVPQKEAIEFSVKCDAERAARLQSMQPYFVQMARATSTELGPGATPPETSASVALSDKQAGVQVYVDVSAFIDVEAEKVRLSGERDKLAKFVSSLSGKLNNENFVSRAPADVVQQQREKLAEVEQQLAAVESSLAKL
ncbi:valine--tRNA ligase [Adhaeretor mobilis]|uniref:Valine--tRNA ligase n=1 Tax=Adhaeretor mobilis TaxID=1930276 RepID=A0A517MSF3_9BACT|nr:valine--tRNA ligase [Adhaeretor mobilis]QDS97810.1 Valine--tRNA ligase [Adhaeretor mobilis]